VETYISSILALTKMEDTTPDLSGLSYVLHGNDRLTESQNKEGRVLGYLLRCPDKFQTADEVAQGLNDERGRADLKFTTGEVTYIFGNLKKRKILEMESNISDQNRPDERRVAYRPSDFCQTTLKSIL
jgi:hypothetical protein